MGGGQGMLASSLQGNLAATHHLHSTWDPGLHMPGACSGPGIQEDASAKCSSAPPNVLCSPGSSLVLLAPSIHQGQHGACSSARSRCDPWLALNELHASDAAALFLMCSAALRAAWFRWPPAIIKGNMAHAAGVILSASHWAIADHMHLQSVQFFAYGLLERLPQLLSYCHCPKLRQVNPA